MTEATRTVDEYLRAGAALYNAGHYLAAHEPWEELWLRAAAEERDDCVQGLVQATAAVHKARVGNWSGARGLATSGRAYLEACDRDRLDVAPIRAFLGRLAADPETVEREAPPPLAVDGRVVRLSDLEFPAAGHAGEALAETDDDEVLGAAVAYAEADLAADRPTSPFVTLVLDYLADREPIVRRRLTEHVRRRQRRDADVDELFEE